MKIRQAALALVALVAAVTLTSVAAAGPDAARQRVAVTTQASGSTASSPFVLIPLQAGSLRRDSGTWIAGSLEVDRVVVREGQKVSIAEAPSTLKGKLGSLVIRYRTEWVDAGNGHTVGADTWKVVRWNRPVRGGHRRWTWRKRESLERVVELARRGRPRSAVGRERADGLRRRTPWEVVAPPFVKTRLGLVPNVPVEAALPQRRPRSRRVDLRLVIRRPYFDQGNLDIAILAEAVGEDVAGRTGAEDHMVVHGSLAALLLDGNGPCRSAQA